MLFSIILSFIYINISFVTLFFGRLTFGFMVTTAFMSMWVSNTATTSMMIPIGQAVLVELVRARKGKSIDQEEKDIGKFLMIFFLSTAK